MLNERNRNARKNQIKRHTIVKGRNTRKKAEEMQIKMKELELEQYRLSKEKEGTEPSVLPSVQNIFDVPKYYKFVPPFWRKKWTNMLFMLRKLLKVWLGLMNTEPNFYRES